MTRTLTLVGAPFAVVLLTLSVSAAFAQSTDGTYKVISGKDSKFQEELDAAVAAGYRVVGGDAGARVAILERSNDAARPSYLYVRIVDKFLKEGKLPPGYRLLPFSFGGDGYTLHALFEKVDGDDQRAYRVVSKGSAGGLRKHFEQGGEGSSGAIAVAAMPGAAAIYESRPDAPRAVVIASGNTGTLRLELEKAGERGLCITDSDGIKEAFYLLHDCPVPGPRKYEVIATTKTETFERELNAAAARGMRIVPSSLVGIEKRVLGSAYNNETVAVVEQVADAAPVTYRVLGVVRAPTFAKELNDAANAGFRLVAFGIGPKEVVAVLEKR